MIFPKPVLPTAGSFGARFSGRAGINVPTVAVVNQLVITSIGAHAALAA